ncbi:MAG: hypothetical protein WAM89_13340 [Terriglobales bacterium]
MAEPTPALTVATALKLRRVGAWSGIRALAWDGETLYGCRGYQIVSIRLSPEFGPGVAWQSVARFRPAWWRTITSRHRLSSRLLRDGFHALAILDNAFSGQNNCPTMVGAIPGAIVTRTLANDEFSVMHQIQRGTRPLHITAVPSGNIYWGEYFDNRERAEVHIYVSTDRGCRWEIAYTFPAGSIRHVHNIVYDRWGDCLWILTGDEGAECKVLRASCDLRSVHTVLAGNQQVRSVAAIPTANGLYLATDTPSEKNHIYRLDRSGNVEQVGDLASSSIYGCRVGASMFFSTMIEPSGVNPTREVQIVSSIDGKRWEAVARWTKDKLSMRYFQYGNAFLPNGENSTRYLAATSIAVEHNDSATTIWEVDPA